MIKCITGILDPVQMCELIINNEKSISHPGEQPLLRYPKTRKAVKPVAAHFTYSYIARPLNGGPAGYLDTV